MKALLILTVLALATAGGIGARRAYRQGPGAAAYTVTFETKAHRPEGVTLVSTATRSQSASGAWHQTKQSAHGEIAETYGDPARGVFGTKNGTMFRLSDYAPTPHVSMGDYRASPQFVREDRFLNEPVAVLREEPRADGGTPAEWWLAPALDGLILKEIDYRAGVTFVKQAVSIERGEPARPLPPLPDLPVSK